MSTLYIESRREYDQDLGEYECPFCQKLVSPTNGHCRHWSGLREDPRTRRIVAGFEEDR